MLRSTITTTTAAAAVCALGGLSACGGTPASDEDRVRSVTLGFLNELAAGDADACDRLSNDGRRQLDSRAELFDLDGCAELVESVAAEYSDADRKAMKQLRIRRVAIDGDRASVRDRDFVIPAELEGQMAIDERPTVLRRHRGDWKLEDLG